METQSKASATKPTCCVRKCPMTLGYYAGGGQYVCWYHVCVVPGFFAAFAGQQPVCLAPWETESGGGE